MTKNTTTNPLHQSSVASADEILGKFETAERLKISTRTLDQWMHAMKRDPRVREVVLRRCRGACERKDCANRREYRGFLDVHHILGVETSDRVWNCVALCPNCHRDTHAGPDRDQINRDLLEFAAQFDPTFPPQIANSSRL